MNTNSNTYTVIYATILVVIVAATLAYVATTLQPIQQRNIDLEKKTSILNSVKLGTEGDKQEDKASYIESEYKKYITETFVVDTKGNKLEGDAFVVDLKTQYDKMRLGDESSINLPVYVCTKANGEKQYILSIYGPGMWKALWGYIALNEDLNTIEGVTFSHLGETPGLGAEIATPEFQTKFEGKQIFENNTFSSVTIVKTGAQGPHQVDGISGGTVTSTALSDVMKMWLNYYVPFIEKQK